MAAKMSDELRGELTVMLITTSSSKQQVEKLALHHKWFGKGVLWAGEVPTQRSGRGIPWAMLLDIDGKPILTGNPLAKHQEFRKAIEAQIKLAKKGSPEMPKDLRGPYKDAARGKWSAAILAVEGLAQKQAQKDEALAKAATEAATSFRARAGFAVDRVGRLIESGQYLLADEQLDALDGDLKGLDELQAKADAFREQLDSEDLEVERKAEKALRKVEDKLFDVGARKFNPKPLEKLAEKYPGTKAAVRAQYWMPLLQS